jgi:DNA repair exonuclease SbcCD nuclease subunit
MRISIISDAHLGFSPNEKLEEDSYQNFEEAFTKALDSDLIILAGDLFDSRAPKTKAWAYALKVLSKATLQENKKVKLLEIDKQLKEASKKTLEHLPVIAIHGNHELRAKGEINAIEALENAGLLIYLNMNKIIFEKDGEKIAIFGFSHVPERFAKEVLDKWNPRPIEGCYNILLLHQNVDPFVYSPLEQPTLNLSNLPRGFDLIVDGHVHISAKEKVDGTTFLIPGSTLSTQFQPSEAEVPKGFFRIDTKEKKIEFVEIDARKFFYEVLEISKEQNAKEIIERKIREKIFKNFEKQPIIKIRISGNAIISDKDLRDLERKYQDSCILFFTKMLETPELTQKLEFLRSLKESKASLQEIGLNILKKSLEELNFKNSFNFVDIFNLLAEEEVDTALNILLGEQKTLRMIK